MLLLNKVAVLLLYRSHVTGKWILIKRKMLNTHKYHSNKEISKRLSKFKQEKQTKQTKTKQQCSIFKFPMNGACPDIYIL